MTEQESQSTERPVFPGPEAPLDVARKLYRAFQIPAGRTLVNHRGDWMRWADQQWHDWDTAELRAAIYKRLGQVDYERPIREKGVTVDSERTPWNPNKHKVANVLEAMAAVGHLSAHTSAPAWIDQHDDIDAPANQVIACTNGLLSLATRTLHGHTPAYYNTVSVPFAYQADAPKPKAWLKFLSDVWPEDPASIDLLQEWTGYIVSGRTDMQKILFVVGPTRSGKGTYGRVLRKLIGPGNVTGPTMASLGTNFGLAPLLGKPLAIVPDARINGPVHTIVERLLSISGEDMLTVDRKFRDPWSGKLPTRLMVLSNEIPRFTDASGAIANRMLVLQMRNSFLGKEDRTLDARLADELPGILKWALEGLDRLTTVGTFTVPLSSNEATAMLMDLASPVSAFVRDCCVRGVGQVVERDRLYTAWKAWCEDNGHEAGAKATFGRNLSAVVPDLGTVQPRSGGLRIRCYTRIGIVGVPSVPSEETADQSDGSGTGAEQTTMFHHEPAPPPPQAGTPDPVPPGQIKPQLDRGGTGGTGELAFKSQPESTLCPDCRRAPARSDTGLCDFCTAKMRRQQTQKGAVKLTCEKWFVQYVADLRAQGVQYHAAAAAYATGHALGYAKSSVANAIHCHPDVRIAAKVGRTVWWCLDPGETLGYEPVGVFVEKYLDALAAGTLTVDPTHFYAAADAAGIDRHTARKALVRDSGRIDSQPAHGQSKSERVWLIIREEAS